MAASAAANTGHSHRAGKLKQQNKKNKRTVSSKRSLNRRKGAGKVQSGTAIASSTSALPSRGGGGGKGSKNSSGIITSSQENKANRLNAIKQRRDASKKNVWNARRFLLMPAVTTDDAADAISTNAAIKSHCSNNNINNSNGSHTIIMASLQRALSSASDPPRIIGIISLSELEYSLEESVRTALMESADQVVGSVPTTIPNGVNNDGDGSNKRSIVTASYSASSFSRTAASGGGNTGGGKQNHQQLQQLTLLTNSTAFTPQYSHMGYQDGADASIQGALDLCRVCDLVLFLIDGTICGSVNNSYSTTTAPNNSLDDAATTTPTASLEDLISVRGERILTAIKAQGLPTPVTVVVYPQSNTSNATSITPADKGDVEIHNEDDAMMKDEDEDEDDDNEEEMVNSLPSSKIRDRSYSNALSYSSHRSMKSIRRSYLRKRAEVKRYISRFAATEFGESGNKVVEIDIVMTGNTNGDDDGGGGGATIEEDSASIIVAKSSHEMKMSIAALIRILCTMSASGPNWVADASRPYLVTDGCIGSNGIQNMPMTPSPVQYDASTQELKLTGYIRGNTLWNVNRPVHVPHLGTYSVKDVRLAGVHVEDGSQKLLVLPPIIAAGRKHRKKCKTNVTKGDNAENNDEMINGEDDLTNDPSGGNDFGSGLLLAESNADARESLDMFASPDALEGEQNLIGFDDHHGIDDDPDDEDEYGQGGGGGEGSNNNKQFQPVTSRPAGWSDYQSAWLDALDGDGEEAGDDHGELAFALNNKSGNKTNDKYSSNDTLMGDDDDDGNEINAEAKRAFVAQRKKDATVDLQFPDEVDYEEETSARDRYARYRALKSFRKSYWDPKENLPTSYGAIYHFASFKATQRDVLEDVRELEEVVKRRGWGVVVRSGGDDNDSMAMEEERASDDDDDDDDDEEKVEAMMARACVPPGAYVTITLENVPPSAIANLSSHTLLCAVSLLPHENKVSVLHMGLAHSSKSEHDAETLPVKSKDVLTFRCGWRTWQSRPIFSQHNLNSDKHKFERFMPSGGGGGSGSGTYFAGSMFGPVSYAPCPVIMFRETRVGVGGQQLDGTSTSEGVGGGRDIKRELLAHGSIIGADADRIVLKRIVLTGYPTRVHKRHATVKYMFYNPEDVKWFMPAGITTKHGLQGHIVQSVGDHGVMKCLFNAPIKQHDTVCLPLYKRIFPKFAPVSSSSKNRKLLGMGDGEDATTATAGDGGGLMKDFRVL